MTDTGSSGGDPGAEVIFSAEAGSGEHRWRWTHLRHGGRTGAALTADPTIPPDVSEALMEQDTLPRVTEIEGTTLLILRGINRNPDADPEDMISLRLAVTDDRIVSVEFRRLHQVDVMIEAFEDGKPPKTPGAFLRRLVDALREEAEPVLDRLEDGLALLESRLVDIAERGMTDAERRSLIDVRQDTIQLQRFIAPQATALEALSRLKPHWLHERRALREEATQFRRIAADLEALRMRAQLMAEELDRALAEKTNRIVLLLSAVSVIFLPLTFLTGLVGVNLGGIPGANDPSAFWIFNGLLAVIGAITVGIAWRMLR